MNYVETFVGEEYAYPAVQCRPAGDVPPKRQGCIICRGSLARNGGWGGGSKKFWNNFLLSYGKETQKCQKFKTMNKIKSTKNIFLFFSFHRVKCCADGKIMNLVQNIHPWKVLSTKKCWNCNENVRTEGRITYFTSELSIYQNSNVKKTFWTVNFFLFLTHVKKVLKDFSYLLAQQLCRLGVWLVGSLSKLSVKMFQQLSVIYRRDNFVYNHCGCT